MKQKKLLGLLDPEDYKIKIEKLTEEESERKMDAEIEYAEKEENLNNQIEKLRLEKEASLMAGLKDRQ